MMRIWPLDRGPLNPAEIAFSTTTPNAPDHGEFMERARKRYPNLPAGAAQNALHCFLVRGPKAAAAYSMWAAARWRVKRFVFVMPKPSTRGVWTLTPKEKRELKERLTRYRAHLAQGVAA